eukprot:TRINITY_DN6110_c0_g2_i2.p1 TRINITY_DN6110_c0_g2~~TRINITY_DN6110_c0_g2_i2.p1  ORF type:complete len:567 (-),score=113.09 TRINITY_DN6110_c0_g2_i2:364-2064(-)
MSKAAMALLLAMTMSILTAARSDLILSDWMGQTMAVIGNQSVLDLSLPGTHDSLTYDLSLVVSDGGIDGEDDLSAIAHDLTELGIAPDLITDWIRQNAQTQVLNVTEQLDNGIRFIDFRIMYEAVQKEWFGLHMLQTSQPSLDYLHQIREWVDAHPKEIVVLWMSKHGSECKNGTDQFPGVSIEKKQAFWASVMTVLDGVLVDQSLYTLRETAISELVAANQRVVIYASDYIEFTTSSKFAADACYIQNDLPGGIGNFAGCDQDLMTDLRAGASKRASLKAANRFWLVSGASGVGDTIKYSTQMHFNPFLTKDEWQARLSCAKVVGVVNATSWCPESLLGYAQLTNYYRQAWFNFSLDPSCAGCDLPNAVYIDGVAQGGMIATGDRMLTTPDSTPVCEQYEWTSCEFEQPKCSPGHTANGEYTALGVVDTTGYTNGPCAIPFQKHFQCCRDQPLTQESARFGYVATLVAANLRRSCLATTTPECQAMMGLVLREIQKAPMVLWHDDGFGRQATWPRLDDPNPHLPHPHPRPDAGVKMSLFDGSPNWERLDPHPNRNRDRNPKDPSA